MNDFERRVIEELASLRTGMEAHEALDAERHADIKAALRDRKEAWKNAMILIAGGVVTLVTTVGAQHLMK